MSYNKIKLDRNKLKNDISKKTYDLIMSFNPPSEDFVILMLYLSRGDERRKILIDFLENECQNSRQLHDFVIERWG